jgi:hypothetical protein
MIGVGLATLAAINSGTRTPVVFIGASALVMASAFIWGVPWGWGYGTRMLKTVRRAFIVSAVALLIMTTYFPEAISGHNNYYICGPGACSGHVLITIGVSLATDQQAYGNVTTLTTIDCRYCIVYEQVLPVYLCTNPNFTSLASLWPGVRQYD